MALVLASTTTSVGATLAAITVTTGDVIVVKCTSEDQGGVISAVAATGQTFTNRNTDATASHTGGSIWTCVVAGSPGTITITYTSPGGFFMIVAERWTGAQLAATPATNATKVVTQTGGFNGSITTAQNGSAVSWCAGDWSANAPGTIAYRSSATQNALNDKSPSNYVGYYATQTATTAGAQSFGTTTPAASAVWKYLAIEVQDAAGGGAPAIPPILVMQTRRAY